MITPWALYGICSDVESDSADTDDENIGTVSETNINAINKHDFVERFSDIVQIPLNALLHSNWAVKKKYLRVSLLGFYNAH